MTSGPASAPQGTQPANNASRPVPRADEVAAADATGCSARALHLPLFPLATPCPLLAPSAHCLLDAGERHIGECMACWGGHPRNRRSDFLSLPSSTVRPPGVLRQWNIGARRYAAPPPPAAAAAPAAGPPVFGAARTRRQLARAFFNCHRRR